MRFYALPVHGYGMGRRAECCCSPVSLLPRIDRRFSGSRAMKRLVSKPNIRWLESSRSRTKPKHPKEWSSPRRTPTSRGASARRCITPITAHSPVAMRRTKTFSGQIGRVNQRGDNLLSPPIGGRSLCQDNKRGQVALPVPLFFGFKKNLYRRPAKSRRHVCSANICLRIRLAVRKEQHRLREAVLLSGRSIGEGQAHIFPVG